MGGMRYEIPTDHTAPLIINRKSEDAIKKFPDNTFDAIVCDPPYELNLGRISGRNWDATGIAFDKAFWKDVNRVLKPGGNLIAFGAPRTYHRLVVALEDANFEIRDGLLAWVKSSGFAKSQKVPHLLAKRGETALAAEWAGVGTGLKPAHEPIVVARKTPEGSIIDNIIAHRVGGLHIDAARVPTDDDRSRTPGVSAPGDIMNLQRGGTAKSESHAGGRWPANVVIVHQQGCVEGGLCTADCAATELNFQSPGAARFFPSFHYQGRAAASERPEVNGVKHLSVKPLALMEWLVGLAALPGQLILDPFAGSGATIEAAMHLGVRAVGMEMTNDYIPLIEHRVERAQLAA